VVVENELDRDFFLNIYLFFLKKGNNSVLRRKKEINKNIKEIGRVKKTEKFPSDKTKACLKFSSNMGPKTRAITKEARSKPVFLKIYPMRFR